MFRTFPRGRGIAAVVVVAMTTMLLSSCAPESPPENRQVANLVVDGQTVVARVQSPLTIELASANDAPIPPDGMTFPFGALRLTVGAVPKGGTANIQIALPSRVDVVRKSLQGAWQAFDHDGATGAKLSEDGLSISLDLTDGGRGDGDGVADGRIVDPLAPAVASGLAITTAGLPSFYVGQADEFIQLETAGATGTVHWSLDIPGFTGTPVSGAEFLSGYGIELSDTGVLGGTLTNPQPGSSGFVTGLPFLPLVVSATDDQTTTTRLLPLQLIDNTLGSQIQSPDEIPEEDLALTGAELPSGSNVKFLDGFFNSESLGGSTSGVLSTSGAGSLDHDSNGTLA